MEDYHRKLNVIFTAVVGHYDQILQPQVIHHDFDYILFTDNEIKEKNLGVWQIRGIPYSNDDKMRVSRWVKTHPEQLLSEYNYSVWMDANLQIVSEEFYDIVSNHLNSGALVSSMWHNVRDCIYDEAVAVAYKELENEFIVIDWLRVLLKEKYPQHNGLFENNVLFRNHRSDIVTKLDNQWWSYIEHYSRRDQLSFNYTLWKLGLKCPYFISDSENARNTTCIKYYSHSNPKTRKVRYCKKNFVLVNYYKSLYPASAYNMEKLKAIYLRIAKLPFPHFHLYALGQIFRVLIHLKPQEISSRVQNNKNY